MATVMQHREARIADRRVKYLQVQFRPPVGRPLAARISDVSEDGFRLLTKIRLIEGSRLQIKLPGLESRSAEVVWWKQGEAGCRFIDSVHPAIIQLLMQKHKLRLQ